MSAKSGKRLLTLIETGLRDLLSGCLVRDYLGTSVVKVHPSRLPGGLDCLQACDLMVQRILPNGTIQATRGYDLYEMAPGQEWFERTSRLPCPWGVACGGHFSAVRRITHRCDFVDAFVCRSGTMLVFSGGYVYRRPPGGKFRKVLKLEHWGLGIGRGVRPDAIVEMRDGLILFGEYFRNPRQGPVCIYGSDDDGQSWKPIHVFQSGQVRHIHALQQDPVTGWLWVCTGDANECSFVGYFTDQGTNFNRIGGGSQMWRVCKLLFTPEHVYWGSDTNNPDFRGIFRWSRGSGSVEQLDATDGPILHATRLAGGTFVMASDREGLAGMNWNFGNAAKGQLTEKDNIPSLWVSPNGASWKRLRLSPWLEAAKPAFGIPQIACGDNPFRLVLTCLNMVDYDGKLLVISEEALRNWFEGKLQVNS